LQVTDPSFDTLLTLAEATGNGQILHKSSHTALSAMVFLLVVRAPTPDQ